MAEEDKVKAAKKKAAKAKAAPKKKAAKVSDDATASGSQAPTGKTRFHKVGG